MTYAAQIVGPSGRKTYLCRGREVATVETATAYSSPSAARCAIDSYLGRNQYRLIGRVVKPSDGEWTEP